METSTFYERVLPDSGTYFIVTQKGDKFINRAVSTLENAATISEKAAATGHNVYFATASFQSSKSRRGDNVASKKALYIDMDCGEGKGFPDRATALTELKQFCAETQLPPPSIIVSSGYGVHAYWTFTYAIPHDEWAHMAERLNELTNKYRFPIDHAITADVARIMRAPGSMNTKNPSDPRECKVLLDSGKDYDPESIAQILNAKEVIEPLPFDLPEVDVDDLSNATLEKIDWYAEEIIAKCPTMGYIADTNGKDCGEPLWMQTLNLLAFCTDGRDFIHTVSSGHPTYDSRTTERKFNLRVEAKEAGRSGPTLCKTFAQYPQAKCDECPFSGKLRSPISLGRASANDPNEIPYPFKQDAAGIYTLVDDKREQVSAYRIEKFEVRENPDTGEISNYMEFRIGDSKPLPFLANKESLTNLHVSLQVAGINLKLEEFKGIKHIMAAWAQQLQAAKSVNLLASRFGWSRNGFIAGGKLITKDGEIDSPIADKSLQAAYLPMGNLEAWKAAADLVVNGPYIELQVLLASTFAAPLVAFSNVSGAVLSIISKASGTGKSSAMKVAQAVWGHPVNGVNALNDTANSVSHRMSTLNTLPLYWDELRQRRDVSEFLNFVFRAGQGRDKTRLTKTSEQMMTGGWKTLITVASNEALLDHIDANIVSTNAGMLRVLELTIKKTQEIPYNPTASQTLRAVEENYGHAGMMYARTLVGMREKLTDRVLEAERLIAKSIDATQDERFWVTTVATIIVGAGIAKSIGLVDFDTRGILNILIDTIKKMRVDNEDTAEAVLADDSSLQAVRQFMTDAVDNTYITERFPGRGHGHDQGEVFKYPDRQPVLIYASKSANRMRINLPEFRKWLMDHGFHPYSTINDLKNHHNATERRSTLTPGLGMGSMSEVRVRAIEMDIPTD